MALAHRLWVGSVLVSVAVLAPAGCGNSSNPGTTSTTTTTTGAAWSRPDTPPDPHTLLRAGGAALAAVPDSTLIFIESETDDAGTWKVRMATADGTEQQVKVGSDGVTVLVGPTPKNDSAADKAKRRANIQAAQLDYRAAVDKALAAVPNGSITKLDLDDTNGTTVWQADVWDTYIVEHQVTINASSGEITANNQV
ncbi:MAG TPA: PepSY domain-containing protein [Mycobacterium sp.]|nr:PepSY domain-containing protein [Mycobacterium sp.]